MSSLRIPLRVVLVVPFLLLISIATGLVGYLSYRNTQETVRDIVHQLQSEIEDRIQDHLRAFLEKPPRINQINANAIRRGWLKADDPNALERHFREQLQGYDSVTSIYFGNAKGGLANAGREGVKGSQYVMVTDGFVKGRLHKYATDNLGNRVKLLTTIPFFDATVRPWYTRAVKTGGDAWSDIYTLVTGQDMAIAASRPVYDERRNLLGVVSIDIFLSQLSSFLKTLDIGKTGISFIMEPSGLLIASSTDEKPLTGPSAAATQRRLDSHKSATPLIRHAAEAMTRKFGNFDNINKAQNFDDKIDDQLCFQKVSPFQTNHGLNWLIVTVMPEADFMAQINVNNRNTALLIGAILMIVIILCIITAQLITIPILRFNTATQSLAKGDWNEIRTVHWLRETGDLTLSFNHMIRQLKQIMGNLTSEIENRKRIEAALRESENRYRELSIVDDLTQLYNSRHFYQQLKMEVDRADRYGQPLTMLLLDLDDFKQYNDAYGHIEGDQVLMRLGQVIKRCLRQTDSAYRYGGEEFTIILPMTTSEDGIVTAERIRTEFKKEAFLPTPDQGIHVTVSIGLAQHRTQEDMKVFVHRADQLMYQGKKNGKDRVCCES